MNPREDQVKRDLYDQFVHALEGGRLAAAADSSRDAQLEVLCAGWRRILRELADRSN